MKLLLLALLAVGSGLIFSISVGDFFPYSMGVLLGSLLGMVVKR